MTGLIFALVVAAILTLVLHKRNEARLRAQQNMSAAVDEMQAKWTALYDAKERFEQDVPDKVMELATWMVKSADKSGIEFILATVLADRNANGATRRRSVSTELREPLDEVFLELVHAWFQYVSNKNLFARFLIRSSLGRRLEKDETYTPYNAQTVQRVIKSEGRGLIGALAA